MTKPDEGQFESWAPVGDDALAVTVAPANCPPVFATTTVIGVRMSVALAVPPGVRDPDAGTATPSLE
jgi:hypothetical protein